MANNEVTRQVYDDSQIQVLEGLEAVRRRPGMYIGTTSLRGLHHLVYEIVDNSIDEALAGRCDRIDVTLLPDGSVEIKDNGQGIPGGIHPKMGIPTLEVIFTVLHAGGKFDGGGYEFSGGLHGVGSSVVNALSEWIELETCYQGRRYTERFERGKVARAFKDEGETTDHGLYVRFKPDNTIFDEVVFNYETLPKVLLDCYESFYRYSNMALVVSGDLDEAEVLKIVDETLPKREWTSAPVLPSMNYPDRVQKSKIEKRMPVSQPIFEIGIKDTVPSENAYERLKRDAEMTILGEMLFSRAGDFYNDIFENGIINESYSYGYSITRDVAFHSIYAESEYPMLVLEKLKEHIAGARAKGLSQRDFVRCKRVLLAEFIRDFESVDDIANSVMNFVFEGANIFEYRKIIEGVTYEDVCRVFDGTFAPDTFAISIVKK